MSYIRHVSMVLSASFLGCSGLSKSTAASQATGTGSGTVASTSTATSTSGGTTTSTDTATSTDTGSSTSTDTVTPQVTATATATATDAPLGFGTGTGYSTSSLQIAVPTPGADAADLTSTSYPDGFYTGFDGVDAFGILLPAYGGTVTYTIADTSIAAIQAVQVTVPPSIIATIQGALTAAGISSAKIATTLSHFGNARTMWEVTALAAGSTTIMSTLPPTSTFEPSGTKALIVASYTPAQYAKGKARYAVGPDGENPACAACHLSGKDGAPPHALGDLDRIPDVAADTWDTTGALNGRISPIPHSWKFADEDEQTSTVAYMRSLQSGAEQVLLYEFAQAAATDGLTVTVNPNGTMSASPTAGTDLTDHP